jgi:hypothetical protein
MEKGSSRIPILRECLEHEVLSNVGGRPQLRPNATAVYVSLQGNHYNHAMATV